MIASLILASLLLVIVGFYGLVRLQIASCEGGVYHAPLDSAEAWSASLDVALGLDMFSTTEEEQVDAMWDMVPSVVAWVAIPSPMVTRTTVRTRRTMSLYTLRDMCAV